MLQRLPAEPGMPEAEIDTPALIVDLDALEANLDSMAAWCAEAGVGLRPHAKTHKSSVIANWQIARGAVGQCTQKVGEAEVLAWGGVPDILVSNEIVTPRKLARLAGLTGIANVAVCADDAGVVDLIEAAAEAAGCRLTVLVEIDVQTGRCGVRPGGEAVALAKRIADSPHLVFGGLQAYDGVAQHIHEQEAREAQIAKTVEDVRRTVEGLADIGLSCTIIGGAGTGTFMLEGSSGLFNELQAGSYVFMDREYRLNDPAPAFRQSLFVLTTVMSNATGAAILDCGHKGIAIDKGPPAVHGRPGLVPLGLSDEHCKVRIDDIADKPAVGEQLRLVPGHCDPTVDRHDWYVGVRNGRVEMVWPVAARGWMS